MNGDWLFDWIKKAAEKGSAYSGNWAHRGGPGPGKGGSTGGTGLVALGVPPDANLEERLGQARLVKYQRKMGQPPAFETREEAEEWARKNVTMTADYEGLDVNECNQINATLSEMLYTTEGSENLRIYRVETDRMDPWNATMDVNWGTGPGGPGGTGPLTGIEGNGLIKIGPAISEFPTSVSKKDHSAAYFSGKFKDVTTGGREHRLNRNMEGVIRHEFGHLHHVRNEGVFDWTKMTTKAGLKKHEYTKMSVTERGKDNWQECVAENFTLYSIGRIDKVHPVFLEAFRETTDYGW